MSQLTHRLEKKIILLRAHQWMRDQCIKMHINLENLNDFLKETQGVIYGSFVLSCLLNTTNFNDIDICVKQIKNNDIRAAFSKILVEPSCVEKEEFTPRYICVSCGPELGDTEGFQYHVMLHTTFVSIDILQTKDPILQHLNLGTFSLSSLYYDGVDFCFPPDFNLLDFVQDPKFKIHSFVGSINFETIYDPWSYPCDPNGGHSSHSYEQFWMDSNLTKMVNDIQSLEIAPIKNMGAQMFIDLCQKHFISPENVSSYRIARNTLRVLKNIQRGLRCENFHEFFHPLLDEYFFVSSGSKGSTGSS
jgi:hypothetical protein